MLEVLMSLTGKEDVRRWPVLAVDIGTTTVSAVAHRYAATGADSWQRRRPETDRFVMERMSSTVLSSRQNRADRKKAPGCDHQRDAKSADPEMCSSIQYPGRQHLSVCAVAGNTTMNHLLVGVNADPSAYGAVYSGIL